MRKMISAILAIMAGVILASAGLLLGRHAERGKPGQPGRPPRVEFTVTAKSRARIDERIWLRFCLVNLGDAPIHSLALKGIGPWESFHVEIVDVDGIFERRDGAGWFLLGQEVRPGKKREPIIGLVPRATGAFHFVFHATDGQSEPLPGAQGQPAAAEVEIAVSP